MAARTFPVSGAFPPITEKEEDDMRKRDKVQEALEQRLLAQGHTCVSVLECYPRRVQWCKQDVCTGKMKSGTFDVNNQ